MSELREGRVTDEPRAGFVAEGPAAEDVAGFVPEMVEPVEPPDESESLPVVDDEFVDPDDELVDPDEDDWPESFGAAEASPIPPVPTSPATPSEKATAPTRNATFAELTCPAGAPPEPTSE